MTAPDDHREESASPRDEFAPTEFRRRLGRALGPLLGALVLDFADLVTIGPLGLYGGFAIGGLIGWWMAGPYGFGRPARLALAALAGIYCTLPFTNFLPVATLLTALGRFLEDPPEEAIAQPEEATRSERSEI